MNQRDKLKVLDLFSGLGGWGAAFRDRGHSVTTLDLDPRFGADFQRDILTVSSLNELGGPFDVVLASPPCEAFSVAAMGKNWEREADGRGIKGPKHPRAELGMRVASHTFALIDGGAPRLYVIENPIGALRVMPFVSGRPDRRSTWYCQWDDRRPGLALPRAKPTDLWTNLQGDFPMCRPGAKDHESAPRGAKTGTQGLKNAAQRSLIPQALSLAVAIACENGGAMPPRSGEALGLWAA